jgi:hypothetical protein
VRGVASIIGEVILVSFTFAIALAYLAYVNSSISSMSQDLPPRSVVEAQKNDVRIMEFESSNSSVFLVAGVKFNVKLVTYLGLVGFDKYGNPVPLDISYAEEFGGSSIMFPNTTIPYQRIPTKDIYLLYSERYVRLSDLNGRFNYMNMVKLPFNSPFIDINATLPATNIEKIRVSAFTVYNDKFYEYANIQVNLHKG